MNDVPLSDLVSSRYFSKREKRSIQVGHRKCALSSDDIQDLRLSVPAGVQRELQIVSQLGLKELWLGLPAGEHNRWHHSVGVFNLGQIWLSALIDNNSSLFDNNSCLRQTGLPSSGVRKVVGYAHILHDYGHLPFAHLFHDILRSMNWVPDHANDYGVESLVLEERLDSLDEGKSTGIWDRIGSNCQLSSPQARASVFGLIKGDHGVPWLNALCNSAIDCDKIDYLHFDKRFLDATTFPVTSRLQQSDIDQWLAEFLSEQSVNHRGYLCLNGVSARAAVDLWRERIFLYERFYLSPELRIPERMAFEIVKQFILRRTFTRQCHGQKENPEAVFPKLLSESGASVDLHDVKFKCARQAIGQMSSLSTKDIHEYEALKEMWNRLKDEGSLEGRYREFLERCWGILEGLAGFEDEERQSHKLRRIVSECLVEEPYYFHARDYGRVYDLLRPLQHAYCTEALIDVCQIPRVLSAPRRFKSDFEGTASSGVDFSILVPDGKPSQWGPGRRAVRPLCDEVVEDLERRLCRILVISPDAAGSPKARYIQDRVRATLLEAGIQLGRGDAM